MAVRSETYIGIIGTYILTIPELVYRNIISVKRGGLGYDIITTGTVANKQVLYTESAGSFEFLNVFTGTPNDIVISEDQIIDDKIFIVWEE